MKRLSWIMLGLLLMPPYAALAEAPQRVGVGGLSLGQTHNIQLASEVLDISTSKIKVIYHFLNTSSHDIKTTAAFPMPAYSDMNIAEIEGPSSPITIFALSVNGKPMFAQLHGIFRLKGLDITNKLKKMGLTGKQIFDPGFDCFMADAESSSTSTNTCELSHAQFQAISKLGEAKYGSQCPGEGYCVIQETAYWSMTIPAGRQIEVTLEYKPFTGWKYDWSNPDFDQAKTASFFGNGAACMSYNQLKNLTQALKTPQQGPQFWIGSTEYKLTDERRWKAPIRDFRLILRKSSKYQQVSLCFPGKPHKTSPTTIEFRQKNFVPRHDLDVYFYQFTRPDDAG